MPPPKFQPALLGGLFMGVLSALPVISAGNCVCCLWVVGGGVLAAYLMQQNHPLPITVADGVLVGLLAGVFGAVITTIVSIPIELALGDVQRQMIGRILERIGRDMPAETQDMLSNYEARGAAWGAMKVVGLMFWTVICAVFGMLGGILGASMFRKDQPPAEVLPPAQG